MGRRKKQMFVSYVDIVMSTYVKQNEYEKAQLTYSNNIGTKKEDLLAFEDWSNAAFEVDEELEGD